MISRSKCLPLKSSCAEVGAAIVAVNATKEAPPSNNRVRGRGVAGLNPRPQSRHARALFLICHNLNTPPAWETSVGFFLQ
jgi:hypothetical protein